MKAREPCAPQREGPSRVAGLRFSSVLSKYYEYSASDSYSSRISPPGDHRTVSYHRLEASPANLSFYLSS